MSEDCIEELSTKLTRLTSRFDGVTLNLVTRQLAESIKNDSECKNPIIKFIRDYTNQNTTLERKKELFQTLPSVNQEGIYDWPELKHFAKETNILARNALALDYIFKEILPGLEG